jgi:hypothetical protein
VAIVNYSSQQNDSNSRPATHGDVNEIGHGGVKQQDVRLKLPRQCPQFTLVGRFANNNKTMLTT